MPSLRTSASVCGSPPRALSSASPGSHPFRYTSTSTYKEMSSRYHALRPQFCGYAAFQLTDGIHHLRLAVSGLLHMTKLIVFVNFHSVRLLGVATLLWVATISVKSRYFQRARQGQLSTKASHCLVHVQWRSEVLQHLRFQFIVNS